MRFIGARGSSTTARKKKASNPIAGIQIAGIQIAGLVGETKSPAVRGRSPRLILSPLLPHAPAKYLLFG